MSLPLGGGVVVLALAVAGGLDDDVQLVEWDLDAVFPLMPKDADYIFTNSSGKRALPAKELLERYLKFRASSGNAADNTGRAACIQSAGTVSEAVEKAFGLAGEIRASDPEARPLVYIGGSTFIVSEAIQAMQNS